MSLTQENSASAYAPYGGVSIQGFQSTQNPSVASQNRSSRIRKTPAATDSTPYTYQEDDTGHITLELGTNIDLPLPSSQMSRDDEEIQRDGCVEEPEEFSSSQPRFEPQTPAPVTNPFANRGSVMKGIDMFGATQPSSVAQRYASPASSRPSPNLYNFATPAPYRTASSPPVPYNETPVPFGETPMLGLRNIRSQSSPQKGSRSLDGLTAKGIKSLPHPKPYSSMKASQERRRHNSSTNSSSDDSDIGAEPSSSYVRKQKRDREIQNNLSRVKFPQKQFTTSSPDAVEVPSTSSKRRLSRDEEAYIAQCSGHEARDTQENDLQHVIADSQKIGKAHVPTDSPTQASPNPQPDAEAEPEASLTQSLSGSAHDDIPDTLVDNPKATTEERTPSPPSLPHGHPSPSKAPSQSLPTMPLQEVSLNRHTSIAPASKQMETADSSTVPETSPVHNSIRPMGDIGLSFGQEDDDQAMELGNIPGFSQDVGFEEAMKMQTSPEPMLTRKSRKVRNGPTLGVIEKVSFAAPASSAAENFSTAPEAGAQPSASELTSSETTSGAATTNSSDASHELSDKPLQSGAPKHVAENVSKKVASRISKKTAGGNEAASVVGKKNSKAPLKVTRTTSLDTTLTKTTTPSVIESMPLVATQKSSRSSLGATNGEPHNITIVTKELTIQGAAQNLVAKLDNPQTPIQAAIMPLSAVESTVSSMLSSAPESSVSTPTDELSSTRNQPAVNARGRSTKGRSKKAAQKAPAKVYKSKATKSFVSDEPTRSSKRVGSLRGNRDGSSADPIAIAPMSGTGRRSSSRLFTGMAFAVSSEDSGEKAMIVKHITGYGGELLKEGFVDLFDAGYKLGQDSEPALNVNTQYRSLGFTAVIANEHSRKPKYMQALALGLPCLSGHWILSCVAKGSIVDWKPYLLCAGQSVLLGNALLSRHLTSYPTATEASLVTCVGERTRILDGVSILAVGCKGFIDEKLGLFSFLCLATGPSRFCQVPSFEEVRKKLLDDEAQGIKWDLIFCDATRKTVDTAIFANSTAKKRKRTSTVAAEAAPKRVRIIDKEDLLQSLIIGQLVEE
jgi:hypothetical protein